MPKDKCPSCDGEKDTRAKSCSPCRFKYRHPRLGTGNGYVADANGYMAGCFNGKYTYQHRDVMEKELGRKLASNEHVHHKDGDRSNNNILNLQLMDASEHARLHLEPRKYEMSSQGHSARWGT